MNGDAGAAVGLLMLLIAGLLYVVGCIRGWLAKPEPEEINHDDQ